MTMIHLAAEKACYVARSVDETPTPAVLKEALETVSEIELLPHLGSFIVSLAMFRRVWSLILITFFSLYQQTPRTGEDLPTTSTEIQMKVVGLLDDGSVLSTEMEDLCANLPIYVIVRRARNSNEKEADVESDEDVNELVDEEARGFPEVTDLSDIPNARKSYWIGCAFC